MVRAEDLVVETFFVGPLQMRCSVVCDTSTGDTVVIDAGDEPGRLIAWNDHGEGTGIEPTVEFGYRYIEALQDALGKRAYAAEDLRLPEQLYTLRKRVAGVTALRGELERASEELFAGKLAQARRQLDYVARQLAKIDGTTN